VVDKISRGTWGEKRGGGVLQDRKWPEQDNDRRGGSLKEKLAWRGPKGEKVLKKKKTGENKRKKEKRKRIKPSN